MCHFERVITASVLMTHSCPHPLPPTLTPLVLLRRPLGRTRSNDQDKVQALMQSIQDIGLQEPVCVCTHTHACVYMPLHAHCSDADSMRLHTTNGLYFLVPTAQVSPRV